MTIKNKTKSMSREVRPYSVSLIWVILEDKRPLSKKEEKRVQNKCSNSKDITGNKLKSIAELKHTRLYNTELHRTHSYSSLLPQWLLPFCCEAAKLRMTSIAS